MYIRPTPAVQLSFSYSTEAIQLNISIKRIRELHEMTYW